MSISNASGRPRLSRAWMIFLGLALLSGLLLRTLYVQDMEYKEDEEYNFTQSQVAAWPWVGMPSGAYVSNPGMSVWVFRAMAVVSRARLPTELARAVQVFAWLGIFLLLPFALYCLRPGEKRSPWLWAMALAMVNPFCVFYQRKLWPEPLLPAFSMLMLAGWWRRDAWWGAFGWGLVGACLGQIHMSGFFLAAGFFLATLLIPSPSVPRSRVRWGGWFAGSVLGAAPLIPWARYVLANPVHDTVARGWNEIIQAKFWVFWVTDSLGLHLGNPLGLLRGQTHWEQLSDFVRYPLWNGHATYLNLGFHALAAGIAAAILVPGCASFTRKIRARAFFRDDAAIALAAALWGMGLLLTLTSVMIRRYYLMVTFPLELVWLVRLAQQAHGDARAGRLLAGLWGAQLLISACFVGYVHVNEGSVTGDYGDAYHVVMSRRAAALKAGGH